MVRFSTPVIDSKTAYIIVCMGRVCDWEFGQGYISLYQYKDGQLNLINDEMIWIS